MPVSYIPSAEQLIDRQKSTAKRRRRNQNAEIDELAKLLPVKPIPLTPNNMGAVMEFANLGGSGSDRGKSQPVDKISVLRIASTFLRFQEFVKKGILPASEEKQNSRNAKDVVTDMMAEAMDGFLLVLDKDATILFVSESITSFIGLTQSDVIGLNLEEITHPEDRQIIHDHLVAKTVLPPGITNKGEDTQPRQFYIRLKSTMSPGRIQLSRFSSYTRIQVTGSLKVTAAEGAQSPMEEDEEESVQGEAEYTPDPSRMETVGFVGECRLIECTSSILEISVPQPHFTTTISLNMKIVAVESQVLDITGFTSDTFVGTRLMDYFHPADYLKLIPCEVMLMHTGHAVSPVFRFMASNGGWIWMQMEGMLRYKPGTKERQFWEVKSKILSQEEGQLALIEQKELYTSNPDPNQDLLNPHKDKSFLSRLANTANLCGDCEPREPIVRKLKEANLSESVINGYLDRREQGLFKLPDEIKTVLHPNDVPAFRDGSLIKRLEEEANASVPPASDSPPQSGGVSPTLTYISTLSSASDIPPSTQTSSVVEPFSAMPRPRDDSLLAQGPPLKRQSMSSSTASSMVSSVPTALVRPMPRQPPKQIEEQSLDLLKQNLDPAQHQTADTSISYYPSVSPPLSHTSSNHSVFDSNSMIEQSQLQHGVNSSNNFAVMPASNAIASVFGTASVQQIPAFSGGKAAYNMDPRSSKNQTSLVDIPFQNIDDITPTLDFGYEGHMNNGDRVLEELLSEVNSSDYVGGVVSTGDHTHGGGVSMYQTNTMGGGLERGVANTGTNSELMEILSQFS